MTNICTLSDNYRHSFSREAAKQKTDLVFFGRNSEGFFYEVFLQQGIWNHNTYDLKHLTSPVTLIDIIGKQALTESKDMLDAFKTTDPLPKNWKLKYIASSAKLMKELFRLKTKYISEDAARFSCILL